MKRHDYITGLNDLSDGKDKVDVTNKTCSRKTEEKGLGLGSYVCTIFEFTSKGHSCQ
jgi:hypothetical protein